MIRVLIADDDPFIRESLQVLLDLDPDLTVCGTCEDGEAAYQFVREQAVDVVLMDIRMPVCNGVEGTRKLKTLPSPPAVLILTTFDDDEYITEALRSGANGYLLKNVPPSRIISGIKTVNDGSLLVHPDIARKLAGLVHSGTRPADPASDEAEERRQQLLSSQGLTQAERHVVQLIADGKSNKEIASALFLSEGTIKNYISVILDKLSLRDRTQLAIYYLKM
ncbi:response regulator transcription factor [Paenibacillus oenotherae]|uniref:Response regulator transcription factor n=1 Tax=Paenibacillus oenotherae TaxID=1435645 RepID=A0ABS7D126_9BACL|nr:response regulator transcription factor [Paenibacillus oenotherae]MBW7473587.1 response regulator transcription factor [Paenibacillus oenotherae]